MTWAVNRRLQWAIMTGFPEAGYRREGILTGIRSVAQPEVVFLDAAGTLFDVRDSVGAIYSDIARRFGLAESAEAMNEAFARAFHAQSQKPLSPGDGRSWWRDIVEAVVDGRMARDAFEGYFEEVFEAFRSEDSWMLFADAAPALQRLRAAGVRLGIISNFDARLLDILAGLGIGGEFESVTLAWSAGAFKPDPKIFRHALAQMDVPARRALHAGDSLRDDALGARDAGLAAVLLDRAGTGGWRGGWNVRSLGELCDLLGV